MEINMNLRLQTFLNLINFVGNMELETGALIFLAVLMTPIIISSLWSLIVAVICQLFWLGIKAGIALSFVCYCYLVYSLITTVRAARISLPEAIASSKRCTFGDIVLTIMFQTGLQVPPAMWDRLMNFAIGGGIRKAGGRRGEEAALKVKKERLSVEIMESNNVDLEYPAFKNSVTPRKTINSPRPVQFSPIFNPYSPPRVEIQEVQEEEATATGDVTDIADDPMADLELQMEIGGYVLDTCSAKDCVTVTSPTVADAVGTTSGKRRRRRTRGGGDAAAAISRGESGIRKSSRRVK